MTTTSPRTKLALAAGAILCVLATFLIVRPGTPPSPSSDRAFTVLQDDAALMKERQQMEEELRQLEDLQYSTDEPLNPSVTRNP